MIVTTTSHVEGQPFAASTIAGRVVINRSSTILGLVRASSPPSRALREGPSVPGGSPFSGARVPLSAYAMIFSLRFLVAVQPDAPEQAQYRRVDHGGRETCHDLVMATTANEVILEPTSSGVPGEDFEQAPMWMVIVWNDPVNLMSYVTWVFQKLFGYGKETARKLMLQVHNQGRATVASDVRERAEMHVMRLHQYGLWATLEKAP